MDGSLFREGRENQGRPPYGKPRHVPAAHVNLEQYRDQFLHQLFIHLCWSGPYARHGCGQRLTPPPPRWLGFKEGSPLSEVTALSNSFG